MPPKKLNVVSSRKNLSSGLMGMKFMRQAESKDKEQQKELKRKVLVDSTHWTLKPQAAASGDDVAYEEYEDETSAAQSSVGFSDLYEANTATIGRRDYGKKPEPVEDEAGSDEDNDSNEKEKEVDGKTKGKRKTSDSSDDEANPENERKRRKQEQKDFNILRQFKSISGSTSVSNSKRGKR
ncbi:hypothetical protein, no similarity [Geotrichum candidum]|uniref:Uncharacterized protein n=1 Tax=Geotrichum candidum TaxID=1173061 RepID=A0A0J9XAW8_GEOCN|nr:hypothetical protein, no similarity [Geotrichum candidum]